jgi:hypothetical protein
MILESNVTAAMRAIAPPSSVAPVVSVMACSAMRFFLAILAPVILPQAADKRNKEGFECTHGFSLKPAIRSFEQDISKIVWRVLIRLPEEAFLIGLCH